MSSARPSSVSRRSARPTSQRPPHAHCRELLASHRKICSGEQLAVWEHLGAKAQERHCLALDQLPAPIRPIAKSAMKNNPPQEKMCHDNAWRLALADPRIEIAEGFAHSIIPMEHSWCFIRHAGKEFHFDPTSISLFKNDGFEGHLELARLDEKTACLWARTLGHSGPFFLPMASVELGLREMPFYERMGRRMNPR